ncbi:MAG: hypothetical protein PHH47_03475 [Gallionella sp.]|nr:hypothetical protein [Gallionella sp.]MDD4946226.1 hypothetical protein [Gallionella sp.]MDD5612521.1 hypothetical protein [Gallionella sp.]
MKLTTKALAAGLLATILIGSANAKDTASPRITVTNLAYSQSVSQYFEVARVKSNSTLNAQRHSVAATASESGSYAAGTYSYIEQGELGTFTNDIKGALLQGTSFRLVQGKAFDAGSPQPSKAEQVLGQMQTGKMAKPSRQPDVRDIIARIKKGEFSGADYVLFGTVSSIEFRDEVSPLQGTSSETQQLSLDLVADFSLINTRTYEIKAAFSAQGAGNDTKIVSARDDVVRHNRGKVIRETSQTLSKDVYQQLVGQLGLPDRSADEQESGSSAARTREQVQQVIILK